LRIEKPITELHKKDKKLFWTQKFMESFQRLKYLLMPVPILKVPNMDKELLVCTNASKEGLGIFFMYDGRVIAYISWKLRKNEENYTTNDLELLAIFHALRV
jgi:hypothetical protein